MSSPIRTAAQARTEGAIAGWELRRARIKMRQELQEQGEKIKRLEAENAALKERIARLEAVADTARAMGNDLEVVRFSAWNRLLRALDALGGGE